MSLNTELCRKTRLALSQWGGEEEADRGTPQAHQQLGMPEESNLGDSPGLQNWVDAGDATEIRLQENRLELRDL